ncbi:hypothetical protein O6H91_Y020200 [Diphasiastrum complanatum]|nr:hypothetical protein O6H91_Y246200 [Diphasiastrum complanatum]KAJ7298043.1 hypothetical protein O6H91_Y020200 [Diphasiastrum complanatum]
MATSTCRVDPSRLRFTQLSIANHFQAPHEHVLIDNEVSRILKRELHPDAFPTIKVVQHAGQLFSLDNRRLWVFRKARVASIKIKLVSTCYHGRSKEFFDSLTPCTLSKFSAPNFFPKVRGGDCKTKFEVPACSQPIRRETSSYPKCGQIPTVVQQESRVPVDTPLCATHETSTDSSSTKQEGFIQRFLSWMHSFISGM